MKKISGKNAIWLLGLTLFAISCKAIKHHNYINPDASSLYSTNPAKPFKYGYAYNREICEKYFSDRVIDFGIRNGEVIADVGAASGWLDGIYSVLVDSVIFYVQDIDTHYLDQQQLDQVVMHYSNQRLTPQTNEFHMVIGAPDRSNLPYATFDKIIICNTLHEIPEPDSLIADLGTKLKPGGKIVVLDQFSSIYKTIHHSGCNIDGSLIKDVVATFKTHGFHLTQMKDPENSVLNYLTFEKDESKALKYSVQTQKVQEYLAQLDLLNQKKTSADSNLTIGIGLQLKEYLNDVHQVFPTLTDYLDDLAEEWIDEGAYTNAINTTRVRLILYPKDADGFYYMGYALLESKKYGEAISWCSQAIQMNDTIADYFNTRGEAFLKLKKYDEALEDFYTTVSLDSSDSEYYFNLGYTYELMGDYYQAISYYSEAIQLEPFEHERLWYRGYAHYFSENYEDAIVDFSKAIELSPENWGYYTARARVKKDMGDKNSYKEDMEMARKVKSKK